MTRARGKNWGSLLCVHRGIKSVASGHLLGHISKKTAVMLDLARDGRSKCSVCAFPAGHTACLHIPGVCQLCRPALTCRSWWLSPSPGKAGLKTQGGAGETLGTGKSYGWTHWCQPTICPGCCAPGELWEGEIILGPVMLEVLPSIFLAGSGVVK